MTNRLCAYIIDKLRSETSFLNIAREVNLSVPTVIRVFDLVSYTPKKLPTALSIDEFKGNTGYSKYQVSLMDNVNSKVIDILPSRKVHDLCQYFKKFPTSKRENVKYFVTDLWDDYKGIAMTYFPKAKVVADRFHFVRYACNAMDKVRIRVQKDMPKSTRKYIKHSKKLLMARPFNLKPKNTERVTYLLNNFNDDLRTSYLLKEQLLDIVKLPFPELAKKLFKEWIENADGTKIPELIECAKTYRNWFVEITNSFYVPYNNGVIEGTNNKIKGLKRMAFGFSNFDNFRTRIFLCTK
jgi:transposase